MRGLSWVLSAKILLTLFGWCLPLLLIPADSLRAWGFPVPEPILFLRLLGMAYLALLLAYSAGLLQLWRGQYPASTVWVGLLSNAGACGILAGAAWRGSWSGWGEAAQWLMWASLLATALITVGLLLFGPLRGVAGKDSLEAVDE